MRIKNRLFQFGVMMDLCVEANHAQIIQEAIRQRPANLTDAEVEDGVRAWERYFDPGSFLQLNNDFQLVLNHNGGGEVTPLAGLVLSGHKLRRLEGCQNFHEIVDNMQNITQFHDTLFEVDCAFLFQERFRIRRIGFSPNVIVAGSNKRPDFEIIFHDGYSVLCECKNMSSVQRIRSSRLASFLDHVDPGLDALQLPAGYRLEAFFTHLPRNYRGNLAEHIVAAAEVIIQNRRYRTPVTFSYETGDRISICINPVTAPPSFRGTINAGFPVAGAMRLENLRRIFTWQDNRLDTAVGALFNRAKRQIPQDRDAILFIKTIQVGSGQQAATDRCLLPEYANILAFGVWANEAQFFGQTARIQRLNQFRR